MEIDIAIKEATSILSKFKIKSPILDTEILMSEAINKDRKFIILNKDYKIKKNSLKYFKDLIEKRSKGMPISYLTKKKYFWKNEFYINKDVLIPRPDTELIVEEVIKLTKYKKKLKILDIGTGSGCILLSILNEKKDFNGVGVDISKKCIDLSKKNTLKVGLKNRVKFFKSDVDNFNYGKYDLIISNPPYINQFDLKYLEKDIIDFEPNLALNGGLDGLSAIRKVIEKSSKLIKIKGKLVLEIGFDQKSKVKEMLKRKGFYINKVLKDLADNDRCIISTKL
jgi:release factor glutamine methyltransferase